MSKQKFKYGDLVLVVDDVSGFQIQDGKTNPLRTGYKGKEVVIMYSYAEKFGGDNWSSYGIMFDNGSEMAWVDEKDLSFISHIGQEGIDKIKAEEAMREAHETDFGWIVANWAKFNGRIPGATVAALMRWVGIDNPWGPQGEGVTYYAHARATINALNPVMQTGDATKARVFIMEIAGRDPETYG